MPLTADLGTIELQSEQVADTDLAEHKVGFDDIDKKDALKKGFLESDAGKNILEKLVALKDDATLTAELRRQKLEELAKGFFMIGDNDTEKIQRLVATDGKQYLRIAYGDDLFDISLDGTDIPGLIKGLIDWYLKRMATVVNEGVEEKDQIAFRYEAEKLVIKQTQEELAALQTQVTGGGSPTTSAAGGGMKWDDVRASFTSGDLQTGFKNLGSKVLSYFGFVEASSKAFASLGKTLQKDSAKAAESQGKWDAFLGKVISLKNTVASAFGLGPKTPPTSPTVTSGGVLS